MAKRLSESNAYFRFFRNDVPTCTKTHIWLIILVPGEQFIQLRCDQDVPVPSTVHLCPDFRRLPQKFADKRIVGIYAVFTSSVWPYEPMLYCLIFVSLCSLMDLLEKYKLWTDILCIVFHLSRTSSFPCQNPLRVLFSNILYPSSSTRVRVQRCQYERMYGIPPTNW